jgi:hypothetical protein
MKKPYFTLWIEKHGYGFTLWSGNGQQLAVSARYYTRRDSARRACQRVATAFAEVAMPEIFDSVSLDR